MCEKGSDYTQAENRIRDFANYYTLDSFGKYKRWETKPCGEQVLRSKVISMKFTLTVFFEQSEAKISSHIYVSDFGENSDYKVIHVDIWSDVKGSTTSEVPKAPD